jgi:cell division protein FtsB
MKSTIFNFVLFGALFYFLFHATYGERGAIAYFSLNKNLEESIKKLDDLRVERLAVEHKVNLLKSTTLDSDFLDEEARRILGYAKPSEEIIMVNNHDQ